MRNAVGKKGRRRKRFREGGLDYTINNKVQYKYKKVQLGGTYE